MARSHPHGSITCTVVDVRELRFDDGTPVRAASGVAPLADGWLVVQDDATHAAWISGGGVTRLRVLDPVQGHDTFAETAGTKHLKPDLEAACEVTGPRGTPVVVLLGSGSLPARMHGVAVSDAGATVSSSDLSALHARIADALGIRLPDLNLEGATPVGGWLRWFQRGIPRRGVASASVDVGLPDLLAALHGMGDARGVPLRSPRTYQLGAARGHDLTITDAVTLRDGAVLASAAAEDTPNAVDDGEILGSALVLLDGAGGPAPIVGPAGEPIKVEGLAVVADAGDEVTLVAVTDADDPDAASLALTLAVRRTGRQTGSTGRP